MADLAVRYAEALLMAARREGALPVVEEEMGYLAHEFSQSADVFSSPIFPVREQLATLDFVLGEEFHPLTKRFVRLLASMRRLGGIGKVAEIFAKMARKEMKQIDLHITVYEGVTPEKASELVEAACLKGLFDSRRRDRVNLQISEDRGLLGGFIAECDGISWDCSLRTRLNDASKVMHRG